MTYLDSRAKRTFDVVAATAGLTLFAPILVIVGCAVALDGRSPVFVQRRLGRHRQPFVVLKLRTMRDGEVTRIGRWLRPTGIDETLQFLNVLRGEMSMVGPRPLTAHDVARFGWDAAGYDARFEARPGITGLAQLWARGIDDAARLDERYGQRASLRLDLEVVALSYLVNIVGKRRVRRWFGAPPASDHGPATSSATPRASSAPRR